MRSLLGRHRNGKRVRVGQANVLRGEDDEPASYEQRVLARLEHASHPVDGCVGIAAAHALDQGRHDVVVLVARTVVQQVALLQRVFDVLNRDRLVPCQRGCSLESVERHSRIAARALEQRGQRFIGDRSPAERDEPAPHDLLQLVPVQLLQPEHAASRQQGRDDLE